MTSGSAILRGAVLAAVLVSFSMPGLAQSQHISVQEAYKRATAGEIVLVDIRAPKEWRDSGVPAISKAITMYQPAASFLKALNDARGGDEQKPIALICATGGRTLGLQRALKKAGYNEVINVLGGMFGTWRHTGWIKARLPVRKWTGAGNR